MGGQGVSHRRVAAVWLLSDDCSQDRGSLLSQLLHFAALLGRQNGTEVSWCGGKSPKK